jgi:hypothetical protein
VGVREQIGRWRDQVATGLAHAGSEEAILQLDRLRQTFPELEWLGRLRSEAQELARRARWTPPTPGPRTYGTQTHSDPSSRTSSPTG